MVEIASLRDAVMLGSWQAQSGGMLNDVSPYFATAGSKGKAKVGGKKRRGFGDIDFIEGIKWRAD